MPTPTSYGTPRPPWAKPGFLVAAAATIALLAVAIVIAATGGQPAAQQAADNTAQPSGTTVRAESEPSAQIPATAPQGVTWTAMRQRVLPYSDTAGPSTVTDSTASGYAHTPTGALIAAAQISSRSGLSAGRQVYEPTVRNQMIPSPDRDTLLSALLNAPQEPAAPGSLSTYAGFRFVTYTPDSAVIELVRKAPGAQGEYKITRVVMVWQDGDWRMQAPPGGSWLSVAHIATDLSGVVEWGPQ